ECLKWKSTSKFVQAKKTVDKLDFHRVCLQSEGNARKGIPFISFDEIALEIQKTFRCIAW
ncbi:hypothetical protein ACQKGD_06560, partial [Peribacillus frigoritolerans]|uniref:hypothetical protein n=1 Tax=Peribacillus frigoritolerans TaxID=450367 RepID=UPI003D018A60